ncbi:MAG TPA: glycosyltransferase family 2 protein [Vicinamibacterales bacterium]|nr:glycosyltransferase family 2 protein [Vicinamibacterales bacterium]
MADPSTVSVVIPAFDEAGAIGVVVQALRSAASWREILVVDDGSADETALVAAAAGAQVITHPYNKGNGAAVKTGIRHASGEYILIIDADGQHAAADALRLVGFLGEYDLVVGARAGTGQASTARHAGNNLLNWIASYLTGRAIPDLTSGLRAARTSGLREFLHLLPNGFSTPTTTTLSFIKAGYSVRFEPIVVSPRLGRSKIKFVSDGAKFSLILLKVVTIFSPLRIFLPIAGAAFALGSGYAVWTAYHQSHITNSSVLLILLAVVIFLVGLVSEQISTLRSEGPR